MCHSILFKGGMNRVNVLSFLANGLITVCGVLCCSKWPEVAFNTHQIEQGFIFYLSGFVCVCVSKHFVFLLGEVSQMKLETVKNSPMMGSFRESSTCSKYSLMSS